MWWTIIGVIVSSVISVIFSDKIIQGVRRIMLRFGILKDVDLSGKWVATFYLNEKNAYQEIIIIKHRVGLVYGHIEPDDRNYNSLKSVMDKKPLRIRGNINDNRYFTGFWYHPLVTRRYHGSYQMLIYPNSVHMEGKWIGFSETSQTIDYGKWVWDKLQDT